VTFLVDRTPRCSPITNWFKTCVTIDWQWCAILVHGVFASDTHPFLLIDGMSPNESYLCSHYWLHSLFCKNLSWSCGLAKWIIRSCDVCNEMVADKERASGFDLCINRAGNQTGLCIEEQRVKWMCLFWNKHCTCDYWQAYLVGCCDITWC